MPARLTTIVIWLILVCLLGLGTTNSLHAADSVGMLAILQPATQETPAGLKFYSPDARLVHELPLPADTPITAAALSPNGLHFVTLSGNVSGPEAAEQGEPLQADLTLHILRTLDGTEVIAIPLLPRNFPDNIAVNAAQLRARDDEPMSDAELHESTWQAFKFNLGAYEWSPDGNQLAFSAAIDGPSSDLYLYNTRDNSVTRLTDGIEQVEGIRWSPNGHWIWHSTISYAYCQVCAGHHYAAAADGSRVVNLPGNDIYRFLAWVDGDTYLVTDQANGPGDIALQRVDVETGESQMLWAGTHQGYIYDAANNRLGIIGTRSTTYDPNAQVFVVDLVTGDDTEYDDLESASAVESWLAPLDQFPVNYPCTRPGPIVEPCLPTFYDSLSPDGTYQVTESFAVEEVSSSAQHLPSLPDLDHGNVLWRPDGAGYFITQLEKVIYRHLATGALTWIEPASIVDWLPLATPDNFVSAAGVTAPPLASPRPAPNATAAQQALPQDLAPPNITLPVRGLTLDGVPLAVSCELRKAHATELTALTYSLLADNTPAGVAARNRGLPLLLAREAYGTTSCPNVHLASVTHEEAPAIQALNAALAAAPPSITRFPPHGALPNLNDLALSPNGNVVATGHSDGTIRLWDFETGTLTRILSGSTTSIRHLFFSSDGNMLAATDPIGRVQMWTVRNGVRSSVHIGRYFDTRAIAWRPYTYDLAIANGSDPVMIHPRDKAAYELVPEAAEALAYSPDGTLLAVALQPLYPQPSALPVRQAISPEERPILIVDADTGEVLLEMSDEGLTYFMTFTPDGKTLVVAGSNELRAWDLTTGNLRFANQLLDTVNGWALTPNGEEIAILTRRGGVGFYDLRNGNTVRNLPVDASVLTSLAIHPVAGQLISGEINGRPLLLDSDAGTPNFRFGPPRARLATTSPSAGLVATADIRLITLHEVGSQQFVRHLVGAENFISDIAFSADGKWLAARGDRLPAVMGGGSRHLAMARGGQQ